MDVVIAVKPSAALKKMLNPVETRILDLWRKTLFYSTAFYVSHKCTGSLLSANILPQRV